MVKVSAEWEPIGKIEISGELVCILTSQNSKAKTALLGSSKSLLDLVDLFSALLEHPDSALESSNGLGVSLSESAMKGEFNQFMRCRRRGEPYKPLLRESMEDEVKRHWKKSDGVPSDIKGEQDASEHKAERSDLMDPRSWKGR